jgi:lysophospholipid acyltransferase
MKTNVWLRECVYKRVTPKGKKPGFWSIMTTVLMSSVWVSLYFDIHKNDCFHHVFPQHGTHGGSYMTLLLAGFITVLSRLCRTSIRPIFLPAPGTSPSAFKCAYDITGTILTILCMNYITAPFFLNTIRDALRVWQAMDWYGLWLIFGGLACFYSGAEKAFKSFHPSQAAETNAMTGRQPAMEDQIPDGCRCD